MDTSENTATLIHAVPAEWAERAHANAAKYKDMYEFSVSDARWFLGVPWQANRLDQTVHESEEYLLRSRQGLDQMVRGWHHECGVELHRPAS